MLPSNETANSQNGQTLCGVTLPNEVLLVILKNLAFVDLKKAMGTCKLWYDLAKDFNLLSLAFDRLGEL